MPHGDPRGDSTVGAAKGVDESPAGARTTYPSTPAAAGFFAQPERGIQAGWKRVARCLPRPELRRSAAAPRPPGPSATAAAMLAAPCPDVCGARPAAV